MNTSVDNYLINGCMRCKYGATPQCKVHQWINEIELLRAIVLQCNLKEEIKLLDEKEESNYIKVQFLHNTYGCRIDLTRQEKKSKSLKSDTHTYGGTLGFDGTVGSQPYTYSKTYIKKTYSERLIG